jgi:glycosyltransferase involved in cell wall biosynthesis
MGPLRSVVRHLPKPLAQALRRAYTTMRNGVGYVRNSIPSPKAYWPDVRGLEAVFLVPALALLPFQHHLLAPIALQAHRLRRLRGRRAVAHPTRVLHVTCSFDLGGTQRQIMNLCEAARRGGALVHEAIEIFPEQNFLYRQGARLESDRYRGRGIVSGAMGRLAEHMSTRSAQTVQIYKLARDFDALRPDVVVGWGHEMCMLTFVAAAIARVPHVVFCIRTFNPAFGWTTSAMGKLLGRSHKRMQPLVSGIITNSTALQEDYARWLGIPASLVRVCPNGIAIPPVAPATLGARDEIRRRLDIPPDALVLCNVARFSAEKGQMLLLAANAHLIARYGDRAPVWLLCGDGPLLPEVQRAAQERGMRNVRFAGRIDDVGAYLSTADVFVMPSDFEGMPNAMMEAMVHGLACVSTDRTGAVDIARDGVEALYCPTGAGDALARQLCALVESPAERRRLGANARERIKAFSIERVTRVFDDCLTDIVLGGTLVQDVHGSARTPVAPATAESRTGGTE